MTGLKLDKAGYNKILSREASEIWLGKSDKKLEQQGCKNLLSDQKKYCTTLFLFSEPRLHR